MNETPKHSEFYNAPPGHWMVRLAIRKSAAQHCDLDPRQSFYVYIPNSHPLTARARVETVPEASAPKKPYPLVVLVHSSGREAEYLRNVWSDMAERMQFVVLCPLFPCEIKFPQGADNYKAIAYNSEKLGHIRYDLCLLDMVEALNRQWGFIKTDRFCLSGFSGGAQFVHRFWYLHPARVQALSINAPGSVTRLQPSPWPVGITNTQELFGITVDVEALKSTAVQLLTGAADEYEMTKADGSLVFVSRVQVLQTLSDDLSSHGVQHKVVHVPGVDHDEDGIMSAVMDFIAQQM